MTCINQLFMIIKEPEETKLSHESNIGHTAGKIYLSTHKPKVKKNISLSLDNSRKVQMKVKKPNKEQENCCKYCTETVFRFEDKKHLKHMKTHKRNEFECPVQGCSLILQPIPSHLTGKAQKKTLSARKESMKRHMKDKHLNYQVELSCQFCKMKFTREKAQLEHLQRKHNFGLINPNPFHVKYAKKDVSMNQTGNNITKHMRS